MATQPKGFLIFETYWDILESLGVQKCGMFFNAMCRYAFKGEEPKFKERLLRGIWEMVRLSLDNSLKRSEAGRKGGQNGNGVTRNAGNNNAQKTIAKQKQNNSKKEKEKEKEKKEEKKEEKEKEEEKKNLHQLAREDEKVFSSSLASPETFQPPTEEEVRRHCEANAYTFKPEKFFSYYESRQWMIGPRKMASWQSVARTWQLEEEERNNKLKQQQNVRNERPYISDAQRAKAARDAEFAAYAQRLLNTPDEKPELPF